MNVLKKLCIVMVMTLSTLSLRALDSEPNKKTNSFWYSLGQLFNYVGQDASPRFQKLGLEVQREVGVTNPLPIKKLNPQSAFGLQKHFMVITGDAIVINEEAFNKESFGFVKATLYKAALCVKNKNVQKRFYSGHIAGLAAIVATHYLYKVFGFQKNYWAAILVAWYAGKELSSDTINQFLTSKQKKEALKLIQCEYCFKEILPQVKNIDHSITELAKECAGKMCAYHANQ